MITVKRPQRFKDLIGRRVRNVLRIKTKGGAVYAPGLKWRIIQTHRGRFSLEQIGNADERVYGVDRYKLALLDATPVTIECDDCGGKGTVQARCSMCDVSLTDENVFTGSDDMCTKCAKEEGL